MKKLLIVLGLITLLAVIVACAAPPTPVPPTPVPTTAPTPAPTTAPTAAPAAKGAWVDEVVFFEEPDAAKAVNIMEAGDAQLYGLGISDPKVIAKLKESKKLTTEFAYGSTSELSFNPAVFKDAAKLNPFSVPAIREAVNWIVDRNYVAKEIYGGVAIAMWTVFNPIFPDFAKVADVAKGIEISHGYNQAKGKSTIEAEMKKLGAELTGGKWTYKGAPVSLVFLIRTEDERRGMGDYIAKQFEDLGFTVDRQYKTAAEASPIWIASDPTEGKWHMYTGGWASTAINRDLGTNFDFYYTARGRTDTLWQAYKPAAEFDKLADRLNRGDYKDAAERTQLMAQALPLSMKDSVRIFIVNRVSAYPRPTNLAVGVDLAAGPFSGMWPFTIQLDGKSGGQVKIAQPSQLTQPWNVVGGSNWLYDNTINRATRNPATLPDPYTGLWWPQLASTAEVTVQQGVPVFKTLDWVTLKTAPTIEVPKDAWADWDAEKQAFITAGERFTQTVTSKAKIVVNFDKGMFSTKWHDGSNLSLGDFIMSFIMGFDRAKEKSPIYDETTVSTFKSFMTFFKGARIVSKDPLTIEIYTDQTNLDAETMATNAANTFFPLYTQGNAPWHTLALGWQADANKELAFSTAKAAKLKVEWMSYISGPSLAILDKYLNQSLTKAFIPYEKAMAQFVTADEASTRYKNASAFYKQYAHIWVGNGPMFLYSVKPTEKIVTIRKFAGFADDSTKWARFAEAKIPTVAITGPNRVTVGQAAEYTVNVNFKKDPYPMKDIDAVKFLVVDATGNLALSADAKAVKDGQWTATLTADQTNKLATGSNRLEVVVVSKLVAIPAAESLQFVTIK
ncbi:MAG: ABC transporter substrate-binding protein [Chloroflexi bacterium]|nr:ABC transporter substrate-binding protein [Chloroflexota bacterium]